MSRNYPSIFNDVIGPVMRGPSSSHVAAAARIGRLIRMTCPDGIKKVHVTFDPTGSLAASYHGHGSDMGLAAGFLNIPLTDERVRDIFSIAEQEQTDFRFEIAAYNAPHPNHYKMRVTSRSGVVTDWSAISVGGGMVELTRMNNFSISVCGDYYEVLITIRTEAEKAVRAKLSSVPTEKILVSRTEKQTLLELKLTHALDCKSIEILRAQSGVIRIDMMEPVLPICSHADEAVPFTTAEELLRYNVGRGLRLSELAAIYESGRGRISIEEIYARMDSILGIMMKAVEQGLAGTDYTDRILGPQAYLMDRPPLFPDTLIRKTVRNIAAIMEVKSAMGLIVAAPTAGSCGCLPGTILAAAQELKLNRKYILQGLLAGGLIGIFIAEQATFAAEIAGCQAECGAASGMTAAAVTEMLGGTAEQCVCAAALALQSVTGLICDPVADRVEVPCLGKNIMGGVNALAASAMALAGFDEVVSLDETINAMYDAGRKLPQELRCTCGCLGKTKTSVFIKEKLEAHERTKKI